MIPSTRRELAEGDLYSKSCNDHDSRCVLGCRLPGVNGIIRCGFHDQVDESLDLPSHTQKVKIDQVKGRKKNSTPVGDLHSAIATVKEPTCRPRNAVNWQDASTVQSGKDQLIKKKSVNQLEYSAGMNWKRAIQLGFSSNVISIIKDGWNPEICTHKRSAFRNNKSALDFPEVVKGQIDLLLQKERIEKIERSNTDLYWDINPLTLVRKPGKDRLCIDTGRVLNKTIPTKKFKIRSVMHRLRNLRTGVWITKIDLKNGYLHIPLHTEFRKYTAFEWNQQIYRYKWLPFGINDAPRVFQAITNEVCLSLQKEGHLIEVYLDDFWIEAETKEKCLASTLKALERLEEIGLTPNRAKSQLEPTQRMTYLGIIWDTKLGKAKLTEEYIEGVQALMNRAQPLVGRKSDAQIWRKLLGKFAFATQLDSRLKPFLMKAYKQIGTAAKRDLIKIGTVSWKLLNKAMELLPISGYEISKPKTLVITSDASAAGGAYWDDATEQDSSFEWNSKGHSSYTELFTAIRALRARAKRGQNNILRTDNKATEAILNGGSSTKDNLNGMVVSLSEWAILNNIRFAATYIKGDLNHRADKASRRGETKLINYDEKLNSKHQLSKSQLFKSGSYWQTSISQDLRSSSIIETQSQRKPPPGINIAPDIAIPSDIPIRTVSKPLQSVLEYHLDSIPKPGYFKKSATALIYNLFHRESLIKLLGQTVSNGQTSSSQPKSIGQRKSVTLTEHFFNEKHLKISTNETDKNREANSPMSQVPTNLITDRQSAQQEKTDSAFKIEKPLAHRKIEYRSSVSNSTIYTPRMGTALGTSRDKSLRKTAKTEPLTVSQSKSTVKESQNTQSTIVNTSISKLRILEGLQNIPKEVDLDSGSFILPFLSEKQLLADRKTIWKALLLEQPILRLWSSSKLPKSKKGEMKPSLRSSLLEAKSHSWRTSRKSSSPWHRTMTGSKDLGKSK
jgi:hypothetical protein